MKNIWILLSLLVISACGFHLREPINWPSDYQKVYMSGGSPVFVNSVKQRLPQNVIYVDSQAEADLMIQVISQNNQSRVLTNATEVNPQREDEVIVTYVIQAVNKHGQFILAPTTITRERDFLYSETDLLSQSSDADLVTSYIYQDIARAFVLRLEASLKALNN